MSKNSDLIIKAPHYTTSPFGYRYINGKKEFHNGTDHGVNGKRGVQAYAVADGIVTKIAKDGYGGAFCYICHTALGYTSLYYHNQKWDIKVKQNIKKGDKVGIVGGGKGMNGAGASTGIHQHFSWIKTNNKTYSYYGADYVDFEKYVFPKERDDEMVEKIKSIWFGKELSENGIYKDGSNYLSPKLADKIGLKVSSKGKTPVVDMNVLKVKINGLESNFSGFNPNGTSYIELRKIVEALGYKVGFDSQSKAILIDKK